MRYYRHNYPSDITREKFELIRSDLESARKKTKPQEIDPYSIFCAVLYVVKGGIQWRMLPSDFPNWEAVYYHFRVWKETDKNGVSTLDRVLNKLVGIIRNNDLRHEKTTLGIVDAKSVQNADTAEEKGYDAGKKCQESSIIS